MQEYKDKEALIYEIKKTADLFIKEFEDVEDADKDLRLEDTEKTPQEIIAYQLGWMHLLLQWDQDELEGKDIITPAPGYKWNHLGNLYHEFYKQYQGYSLKELQRMFIDTIDQFTEWVDTFPEDELFSTDKRKWASSTPSNWPIWKWIHINTAAPFKSFRSKIRKWKKLRAAKV